MNVLVSAARWESEDVIGLSLVDPHRATLPPWAPGAHVDLHLPSGLIRQYSLCGDPASPSYRIAVQRDPASRGGSREVHETQLVGRHLEISEPRNHFPLVPAQQYLFLAGGIGITPLLPMLRAAEAGRAPWHLVYGARRRSLMPFVDEISVRRGGTVELFPQDTQSRPDVISLVSDLPAGAHIYCCGPPGLIAAAQSAVRRRPEAAFLHVERFEAAPLVGRPAGGFEVELRRTGLVLQIPLNRTLLEVVRDALPDVDFSCEEGVCGSCETSVLAGVPDHRDSVLTEQEQDSNQTMMICVSRSHSARLVLDL